MNASSLIKNTNISQINTIGSQCECVAAMATTTNTISMRNSIEKPLPQSELHTITAKKCWILISGLVYFV